MARTYTKPPLIEAVCDLKFASSQAWDWTIPGIFYKHIRNDFPIKKQINTVDTQVDLQQGKFIQQVVPQLQFASETHDTVMRIAPDMLSIQRLPPYDGWKSFKNRIIEYLELYCESAHPSKLTQVALRYVNHIEIPLDDTELEEYFHVLPQVPTPIPQIFPSFLVNVDVPYEEPWEEDLCIEMPPRFIRVRYMGRAKPLEYLDDIEEEDSWEEEDPCIEMPPRSVEKVVLNVKDMGRAKPLPFDFDDMLLEEE